MSFAIKMYLNPVESNQWYRKESYWGCIKRFSMMLHDHHSQWMSFISQLKNPRMMYAIQNSIYSHFIEWDMHFKLFLLHANQQKFIAYDAGNNEWLVAHWDEMQVGLTLFWNYLNDICFSALFWSSTYDQQH